MTEDINEILHLDPNEVAKFEKIMNEINGFMDYHKNQETPPTIDELDQFHKTWFYNNWRVRFRRLSAFTNLGARGVIAIPNTTFEEWLWWFHEWAEALTDDYNEFKKMVYEALLMIQKHLEAIDKVLQNHEQRITKIENDIKEIKQEIKQLGDEITQIKKDISNINNQINNIQQNLGKNNDALQKILQALKNIGVWNQTGGTIFEGQFAPGKSIAGGNINVFGGTQDGDSWIRTNPGQTENDITAGI